MKNFIVYISLTVFFFSCQKYEPVEDWRPVTQDPYGQPKYVVNVPCENNLTDNQGKIENGSTYYFPDTEDLNMSWDYHVRATNPATYPFLNIIWEDQIRPKKDTVLDISRHNVNMYLDFNYSTYANFHSGLIYVNLRNDSIIFSICEAEGKLFNSTIKFKGRVKYKYQ